MTERNLPEATLTPEEAAVRAECLAKLKRSSTRPTRVLVEYDGETYFASAFSELAVPPRPGPPVKREREIGRMSAPTALEALTLLRDYLA